MKQPLSRRARVRTLTFITAAFVVLCGIALNLAARNIHYQRAAALAHARAFSQLTDSVDKLDAALEKSIYVTTPNMISSLCTEIYGESLTAQQAIGELPYGNLQLEQTAAFIARTGAYAQSLAHSAALRGGYRGSQLETVRQLSKAAAVLSGELDELEARLNDGTLTLDDAEAVEARLSQMNEDITSGSNYESIESDFPDLPTLIYDGPFSEHLQSRKAAMLEQEQTLTRNQARAEAAQFLELEERRLSDGEDINGEIPCYCFLYTCDGENRCTICVTKQGGYILSIGNERAIGAPTYSFERAVARARDFLREHEITDLTESYYICRDNSLTINFAATQDAVTCYPDLIKVEVALDNGEIVGFESAGYLMNHTTRENLSPRISCERAQQAVSGELTVLSHRLALIPTKGEHEALCWEFKCKNEENRHYIVYINAKTGEEQQILILLEDESGTLVL